MKCPGDKPGHFCISISVGRGSRNGYHIRSPFPRRSSLSLEILIDEYGGSAEIERSGSADTRKVLKTAEFQPITSVVDETNDLLPIETRTCRL
jgi:hypothetical protein